MVRAFLFNQGKKEMEERKNYLKRQINACRAMAKVCQARKEYTLQVFYMNAEIGYKLKLQRLEKEAC